MRDGHSSATPVARRLVQPTRTAIWTWILRISPPLSRGRASCRPYSVLLPVGFAVPFPSPGTRCALTAPFHPYRADTLRARRSVLCGTFPRVAPAGCYPAPYVHGARTFLPGDLSAVAGVAVRPTDNIGMGCMAAQVKSRAGRVWFMFWAAWRGRRATRATSFGSNRRRCRRRVRGGNGAETQSPPPW